MLITPADLASQYEHARAAWPSFDLVAHDAGVPRFLLYAVGSRETNLDPRYTTGTTGDGGHGHGLFQLDDRWHTIPAGFDTDPRAQAVKAAAMLAANMKTFGGQIFPAVCAYNCGVGNAEAGMRYHHDADYFTTHSQGVGYGAEVIARYHFLLTTFGPPPLPPWYHRVLSRGSVGADVIAMKHRLRAHGLSGFAVWSPVLGPGADKALRAFQVAEHLVDDGDCGPKTATKLGPE